MKKSIAILGLTLLATAAVAQQVTITKKDSTTVSGRVGARSATAIYVNNNMIGHKDIVKVSIEETGPQAGTLIEYLNKYSIPATQSGTGVVSNSKQEVVPLQGVDLRMDKFARQRDIGKGMQALGLLVGIVGPILTDELDSARGLAIGGAVVSLVGFGIDIDASKHLKSNR